MTARWSQRSGGIDDDCDDGASDDSDFSLSQLHMSAREVSKRVAKLRLERTLTAGRRAKDSQELPRSLMYLSRNPVMEPSRLRLAAPCSASDAEAQQQTRPGADSASQHRSHSCCIARLNSGYSGRDGVILLIDLPLSDVDHTHWCIPMDETSPLTGRRDDPIPGPPREEAQRNEGQCRTSKKCELVKISRATPGQSQRPNAIKSSIQRFLCMI